MKNLYTALGNKRYWFLLIIFVVLFLFGKSIPSFEGHNGSDRLFYSEQYIIDKNGNEMRVNSDSCGYGLCRLSFAVREIVPFGKLTENVKLEIYSLNLTGSQKIGEVDLGVGNKMKEINYHYAGPNNGLQFNVAGSTKRNIIIDNLRVTQLDVNDVAKISELKPSIYGVFDSKVDVRNMSKKTSELKKFSWQDEKIGQIFSPAGDMYLSSVAFQIGFEGNGGGDLYNLELREATKQGENYELSPNILSGYAFTTLFAKNNLLIPGENNVFRFPLFAHLVKGKTYWIGFANTGKFNLLNRLIFYGDKDGDGGVYSRNSLDTRKIGALNYIIFESLPTIYDHNLVPNGAYFQDKGNGNQIYFYDANMDYEHIGIISKTSNEIIYKLSTIYPARYGEFNLNSNANQIFLSFDGKEWKNMGIGNRLNISNIFKADLQDNKNIYLKLINIDQPLKILQFSFVAHINSR